MKLIDNIRIAVKILLHFSRQHNTTLSIIEGTYERQPSAGERTAGIDTMLSIKASGNFYTVMRTDYVNNISIYEETWLAIYGWHSNGHIIEIGGNRICIFDTVSKSLYLETLTEQGKITLELFIKNL